MRTKYKAFFVVGVPPARIVKSARYDRWSLVENGGRRLRLRAETLLSFPGASSCDVADGVIRDGTTLEEAICNFCYPDGYTTISCGERSKRGAAENGCIYFPVRATSGEMCEDSGAVLWCTALRWQETIQACQIIPHLIDMEASVASRAGKKPGPWLAHHLGLIDKHELMARQIEWSTDYYYVLVTDRPCYRWAEGVLRLFRSLSSSASGKLNQSLVTLHTQRDARRLGAKLADLGIPALPWARRGVQCFRFAGLLTALDECESTSKLGMLRGYVENVGSWLPGLLPLHVSPDSRALLVILHEPDVSKARKFVELHMSDINEASREVARLLMEDEPWIPEASRLDIFNRGGKQPLRSSTGDDEAQFDDVRTDECLLHNSEVLYGEYLLSGVPSPVLCWLQLSMILETKAVVSSTSVLSRGAIASMLVDMIYPYQWLHTWIPVLPSTVKAADMMESPVPFVIGVSRNLGLPTGNKSSLTKERRHSFLWTGFSADGPEACPISRCSACSYHAAINVSGKSTTSSNGASAKRDHHCKYHLVQKLLQECMCHIDELTPRNPSTLLDDEIFAASPVPGGTIEDDALSVYTPSTSGRSACSSLSFYNCPGTVAVNATNWVTSPKSSRLSCSTTPNYGSGAGCGCSEQQTKDLKPTLMPDGVEDLANWDVTALMIANGKSRKGKVVVPRDLLRLFEDTLPDLIPSPATGNNPWIDVFENSVTTYQDDLQYIVRCHGLRRMLAISVVPHNSAGPSKRTYETRRVSDSPFYKGMRDTRQRTPQTPEKLHRNSNVKAFVYKSGIDNRSTKVPLCFENLCDLQTCLQRNSRKIIESINACIKTCSALCCLTRGIASFASNSTGLGSQIQCIDASDELAQIKRLHSTLEKYLSRLTIQKRRITPLTALAVQLAGHIMINWPLKVLSDCIYMWKLELPDALSAISECYQDRANKLIGPPRPLRAQRTSLPVCLKKDVKETIKQHLLAVAQSKFKMTNGYTPTNSTNRNSRRRRSVDSLTENTTPKSGSSFLFPSQTKEGSLESVSLHSFSSEGSPLQRAYSTQCCNDMSKSYRTPLHNSLLDSGSIMSEATPSPQAGDPNTIGRAILLRGVMDRILFNETLQIGRLETDGEELLTKPTFVERTCAKLEAASAPCTASISACSCCCSSGSKPSEFQELSAASAALGQRLMKYLQTPQGLGRTDSSKVPSSKGTIYPLWSRWRKSSPKETAWSKLTELSSSLSRPAEHSSFSLSDEVDRIEAYASELEDVLRQLGIKYTEFEELPRRVRFEPARRREIGRAAGELIAELIMPPAVGVKRSDYVLKASTIVTQWTRLLNAHSITQMSLQDRYL